MADKKPLSSGSLEVSELEDESLEGVTGGDPVVINTAAGCGVPLPVPPTPIKDTVSDS